MPEGTIKNFTNKNGGGIQIDNNWYDLDDSVKRYCRGLKREDKIQFKAVEDIESNRITFIKKLGSEQPKAENGIHLTEESIKSNALTSAVNLMALALKDKISIAGDELYIQLPDQKINLVVLAVKTAQKFEKYIRGEIEEVKA